jgi:hypothetical protein
VRGKSDHDVILNIVLVLACCLSGTLASAQNKPPAAVDLSTLRTDQVMSLAEQKNVAAQAELRLRAERADPQAELEIGSLYAFGQYGLPLDYTQAAFWFLKAASQTVDDSARTYSAMLLGWCYENGKGVPKDDAQAIFWYGQSKNWGAGQLQQLLAKHPELNSVRTAQAPIQVASTQSVQSTQTAQQQANAASIKQQQQEIADKIQELQSDIEEHESAVETWNDTLQTLAADNSNCSGISALICQGIGQAGVAKAQAERNKELNAARADRAEISRLQGETAELSQRLDESFAGNLQQVVSQGGTSANTGSNPQSLAIQRPLGQKPQMDQELRNTSPTKGCWNGKNGAASGIIPGSQTWSACPAY